jgi:RIO kinase 1
VLWFLYEQGKLRPDGVLTGKFVFDQRSADVETIMLSIEDARQEAIARQLGREEAAERD